MNPPVQVAVAAPNDLACAAAVDVAAAGGNAVDAAIAAALVTMCTEPGLVSLGGAAYVTIGDADGSPPVTVDGGVTMPGHGIDPARLGGGLRLVSTEYAGGVDMLVGHGAVATPGALRAIEAASRRSGRLPWAELLAPAIAVSREGFPHGQASHLYLGFVHDSVFGWQPASHATVHDADGGLTPVGATIRIEHLAESLEQLAEHGADAFYTGDLAAAIVAEFDAGGGVLTAEDLAGYRAITRPSLSADVGRWSVSTNPAPAVGGVVLAALLTMLADRPSSGGGWSDDDRRQLVRCQHSVLRHRADVLDVATDRQAAAALLMDTVRRQDLSLITSPSTTHVSVVGADGSACAITCSSGYGSGVVVPATGISFNNCLGEPELTPHGAHAEAPGTRLLTAMAPTVARRDDGAVIAIGSPASDRIPTAIAQTLLGHINGGLALDRAVAAPRAHVRIQGGEVLDHEADWPVPPGLDLPTRQMPVHSMYFGGVGAASWSPARGLDAAGDPRRVGATALSI
uniref:Gamma-glutamyltranspeptidase @ Glutathione hydrolase n=1 Tax=uncultured Nocardioidaceae bacterium TaxID=253824 RepID=A0A6J4MG37_9ACTN|nr:MAG: Gamma-glutamyltranspeptidase @ Glutathione hydrolase [uncultured Nocardioidaceae bacterium]